MTRVIIVPRWTYRPSTLSTEINMNSTVYMTTAIHLEETILELDMECWAWACTLWYIDGQQDIRWIGLNKFWSYWHFDGKRFWTGTLRSSKVFTTGWWRGIAGDMQCLTILQTEEKRERERGDRQRVKGQNRIILSFIFSHERPGWGSKRFLDEVKDPDHRIIEKMPANF